MTREQFEQLIAKVGWTVQKSNNGLNDILVSPTGVLTDIRVLDDRLQPYSNHLYGGESFLASANWYFNKVRYNDELKYVSVGGLLLHPLTQPLPAW